MFGYIRPFVPELRVADHELYKGVYCGLCRALSLSYGPVARFVLSYDFTFTALLHVALSGDKPAFETRRCPYKLTASLHLADGPQVRFSSAMAAIMIYYKLLDDISDNGLMKGSAYRAALPFAAAARKKATALYPKADAVVAEAMESQRTLETLTQVSLDEACEPSSKALGALFGMMTEKSDERRVLERLGYMLGRYVYCCDAISDVEPDKQSASFNPLLLSEYSLESLRTSLYLTQAEIISAYDLLNISHMKEILDNILTLGLRQTTDTVLQGVKNYEQSL